MRKKQGNAIKKKTRDNKVSGKLSHFEKMWIFPLIYYQKLFLRNNVTPYMNRRCVIPLGSLYFLTQNF